jgi:hypothetical protein
MFNVGSLILILTVEPANGPHGFKDIFIIN